MVFEKQSLPQEPYFLLRLWGNVFFFLFHKGATGGGGGGGNTGFASGTLSFTAILRKVKTLSLSSVVHCCIKIYIEDIY